MILVSCAKPTPPAPSPQPTPVYQSSPVVKASLIEIPASSDLNAVGIWQNIRPIINGEISYVRNLVCVEESGETILYAGTGEPGRILKWSEATSSWSDIGYKIPKLMEELGEGVNPFRWVGALTIDPTDSRTIYVGTGGPMGVAKTIDSGANWEFYHVGQEPRSLVIGNQDPNLIYLGTNDGLLKSGDGGKTWKLLGNSIATWGFIVWTVAINPNDDSMVFAGGEDQSAILKAKAEGKDTSNWRVDYPHIPRLFYSEDGGETWLELTSHSEKGHWLPGSDGNPVSIWNPLAIEFNLENSQIVYLATEGKGLFRSLDGGETWESLNISGAISSLIIHPMDPQILYLGMCHSAGSSVFQSRDGGQNWREMNEGLEPKRVASLAISKDGALLYGACIYTPYPDFKPAGVWRLKLK